MKRQGGRNPVCQISIFIDPCLQLRLKLRDQVFTWLQQKPSGELECGGCEKEKHGNDGSSKGQQFSVKVPGSRCQQ